MAKKVGSTKRKAYRGLTIFFAVLLCICVLVLPAVLILDETNVVKFTEGVNRSYTIWFCDEEKEIIAKRTSFRGEKFDYTDVPEPTKNGSIYKYYTFVGWDLDNDGFTNSLPEKAYTNWIAVAVFMEVVVR